MSAEIVSTADGIMTAKFSGKLTHPEFLEMQKQAAEILNHQQKVRILVIAENFQGWEQTGDWGDVSFQANHDHQIERMAIVCEKKWEDLALLFTAKGFRKFPIEYFPLAQITVAQAWLAANSPTKPNQTRTT